MTLPQCIVSDCCSVHPRVSDAVQVQGRGPPRQSIEAMSTIESRLSAAWRGPVARERQLSPALSQNRWHLLRQYRARMNSDEQLYLSLKAKVKSATRAVMSEPDWAANMEIVDMSNEKPVYIPHISRVLKKRICHWNPNVGYLALTLVEALVKNCPAFHPFVTSNEFVDSMLKELYRKKEKKTLLQHIQLQQQNVSEVSRLQRRDKILLLIESWGESAKQSKSFSIYQVTYNDLKRQGFSFPVPLKDEISPVFTPQAKPRANPDSDESGPVKDQNLQENLAKIELLMDTLNEADPDQSLEENTVIQAIKRQLESDQTKIMERIGSDPSEELMNELLIVNDEICQALEYYKKIASGKLKLKRSSGPKVVRGKGQRVSAVAPQFADLLGVAFAPSALIEYTSESEEDSQDDSGDDDDDEQDPKVDDVVLYKGKDKKVASSSSSSGKSENNNLELVTVSKGIAPPRSNNKVRALKTSQTNESKDQWSKDSSSNAANPFDSIESQTGSNQNTSPAGSNPFATGDELLSSLVSVPKNSAPAPKKPDLSMFDML